MGEVFFVLDFSLGRIHRNYLNNYLSLFAKDIQDANFICIVLQ